MKPFEMLRLGMLMEPDGAAQMEVEGVLNPAAARGPNGDLYLFPRYVGAGNYSRIGVVRVVFDGQGNPSGVEKLGIALEPETDYETWPDGRGGCEDARVAYVEPLGHYVMTYTAWSPQGPRIAIARSPDLIAWERVGLAKLHPYHAIEMGGRDNKDACVFPSFIEDPHDHPSMAMLHRPLFPGTRPEEIVSTHVASPIAGEFQTIWISYWHWHREGGEYVSSSRRFVSHRPLAMPEFQWEKLKIGAGTPPVLCRHGWLIVHHGVQEAPHSHPDHRKFFYAAGVMILDRDKPHHVLYRSPEPVLFPTEPEELLGTVDGVVFPTGIDRRDDIGQPDRFDVYYGMADNRIGVATLQVPEVLPEMPGEKHHLRHRSHAPF